MPSVAILDVDGTLVDTASLANPALGGIVDAIRKLAERS
jgi:beta-phosphoglucomutase-like phosphatase (HAD superfamily)